MASTKFLDIQEIHDLTEEAQARAEEDRSKRERVQASIEANNLVAAAKKIQEDVDGPHVERLANAISRVQEALASPKAQDVLCRCSELRQLLKTFNRERPGTLRYE